MAKNLLVAYFLWFFFGWSGLPHFYLGRDRQAFVWFTTFGGFWGLGWMRDLWRIPDYVDEANGEDYFMYELKNKMKRRKKPSFSIPRFAGMMMTGYFYGILMQLAIPEQVPTIIQGLLISLATTTGVYLVGNIGREEGPFKEPFLVTMCTWVLLQAVSGSGGSFSYCALASAITFYYNNDYDDVFKKSSFFSRISKLFIGGLIFSSLWLSFLYFNGTITIASTKEKIRLRDAMGHFFTSPAWLEFKETLWRLYREGGEKGWSNAYDEFVESIDPTGEKHAYKVLGVRSTSTDEEIRSAYKKLVVKWHPDKSKGTDKQTYEKKFIQIQEAYEIVSKRRKGKTFSHRRKQKTDL